MPDFWNDPNSAWTTDWNRALAGDFTTHAAHWNPDGSYTDENGNTQSLEEINKARAAAGQSPITANANGQNPGGGPELPGAEGHSGLSKLLGLEHEEIIPGAPGSSVDTSAADEERARLGPLLDLLREQAKTGGGAWEQSLKDATGKASGSAQALGQSMPGVGYATGLQNIGNTQGAIGQQAAGQAKILREQQKKAAQDQLASTYAGLGGQDAAQAADEAAARQGVREANVQSATQSGQTMGRTIQGAGQAVGTIAALASKGGTVPGKAKVFGDDEKNDTVPAMLSPGEVVIPRTSARSPEAAAAFVRALAARHGVKHFADGGISDPTGLGTVTVGSNLFGPDPKGISVENGGLLDTTAYDANRDAALQNSNLLAGQAQGNGPSVAGQKFQSNLDSSIANGMLTRGRPGGPSAATALLEAGRGAGIEAGNSAETRMKEQQGGQKAYLQALLTQRAQDQAIANAKQQAAFRNTMLNMGLDAAQQAALRSVISGAGQAVTGAWQAGGKGAAEPSAPPLVSADIQGSSPGEFANPYDTGPGRGGASDISTPDEKWKGGIMGLGYAKGGTVWEGPLTPAQQLVADKRKHEREVMRAEEDDREMPEESPSDAESAAKAAKAGAASGAAKTTSRHMPAYHPDDSELSELAVQRAMGGKISPAESTRAKAFLAALRRKKAA